MLIVLDTTETFADLRMEGANYTFLRSFVSRNPVKLVIPQIVFEETVNHFRESLTRHLDAARTEIRLIRKLAPEASVDVAANFNIDAECSKYRKHLKTTLGLADQVTYDDVGIGSLVQRALARRKPFDSGGRAGFRDAVLWETVLKLAKTLPNKLILVTRNKKDFGEHGRLHTDLCADLATVAAPGVSVIICDGLNRFVDEYVKPNLERLDEIQEQVEEGDFPGFDAIEFFDDSKLDILDELRKHVRGVSMDHVARGSVYHFRCPALGSTAKCIDTFRVADVWRVNEGQLGIGVDYDLRGSLDCLRDCDDDPFARPYNDDYSDDVMFTLLLTVVIEEKSGEVVSWELTDIEVRATGDWGIPEYDD